MAGGILKAQRSQNFGGHRVRVRIKERNRKFRKTSLEQIDKIEKCSDIVGDWDDWTNDGFKWWKKTFHMLAPPPLLTISQWADLYRKIPSEFAAEPGDWHTDKMECMREIMDSCSPQSKWRRVVVVKPTQSGGTEAVVLNTIGYTIDINPRSMIVVFPTVDMADSFSKERLEPMINCTPTITDKVIDTSSARGGSASTVKKKKYPGGFANFVGANSATGLSSRPVPLVIMDEVDLCIKNAGKAGNPTRLLTSRTTTFFDKKELFLSSPINEQGESGIVQMWEDGTRAKLERECPNTNCLHWQVLEWEQMDLETAMLACIKCGSHYPQWKWQNTFANTQRWNREIPNHESTDSFWLTGLDSPWLDWKTDLCMEYKEAKRVEDMGDDSLMKVFVNSKLARQFKKRGKKIEVDLYHDRREVYDCHNVGAELPDGVILVTAGVDVMDSFISYDVRGWGRGRESWGIEAGEFQGDPSIANAEVWKQLDMFVFRRLWYYTDGKFARTRLMFIDSQGHKTDAVYKYAKARHPRCFPIKGVGGDGHPIIIGGKRRERGDNVWLVRLGVDNLKDELHSRLEISKPGPGYCHWPKQANDMPSMGYTLEYFEEIISEQRVLTYSKDGFAKYEWTKNRTDANEALDCIVYARAALEYVKVRLEQMPKDTISDLPLSDIERVEIGLDKVIRVDKKGVTAKRTTVSVPNRYGSDVDKEDRRTTKQQSTSYSSAASSSKYGGTNTSF